MATRKTQATKASVAEFLKSIEDPRMREDCRALARIMQAATGARPRMWGSNLVGFGIHREPASDGRITEWMLIGFSPRRTRITIHIMDGLGHHGTLLAQLGPHSVGQSCLYVKRLSELRRPVLTKIISASVHNRKRSSVKVKPPGAAKPKPKTKSPAKATG
jgi:hypothetical protein